VSFWADGSDGQWILALTRGILRRPLELRILLLVFRSLASGAALLIRCCTCKGRCLMVRLLAAYPFACSVLLLYSVSAV
jgi:hypothetical protein